MQHEIGPQLLEQLNKIYQPNQLVSFKFGRYDVATKTDADGRPRLLFIGKADGQGLIIKGDQFTRHLVRDANGIVVKDHWDYKGNV